MIVVVDKNALAATLATVNYDASLYTEISYAAFDQVRTAATEVLNDDNATQEEVDAATTALLRAIQGLEKKTTGGLQPEEGGKTGDGSYLLYLMLMMAGLAGMAVTFRKRLVK